MQFFIKPSFLFAPFQLVLEQGRKAVETFAHGKPRSESRSDDVKVAVRLKPTDMEGKKHFVT